MLVWLICKFNKLISFPSLYHPQKCPSSDPQLAWRGALRFAAGRGRLGGDPGGVRRLVPRRVPAQAAHRRPLPQVVRAPEGGGPDRPRGHRVHASAARVGRDLEEPVRDPRDLQVHHAAQGDAQPVGQSAGAIGQHPHPRPDARAAAEDRVQGGLGQPVSRG